MSHRSLITGISGFVGGFLAEHLLESGDAVIGCSPDGQWEERSPSGLQSRVELLGWDLARETGLTGAARRRVEHFAPDVLYHLAAMSVPDDCGAGTPTHVATAVNVQGTRRVLELAGSLRSSPRLLFVSTSHVYAPVDPRSPKVGEEAPLDPQGGYGRTKLAAEEEVRRAVRREGCHAIIARAFPHTGPRQGPPMMLPQWIAQFVEGQAPVEVHTLDARIDLADVRDVVRAYRLLALYAEAGTVYNVGSGTSLTSAEVFEMVRRQADPTRPVVEMRPGFKQDPIADTTRLTRATGWRPEVPLERTVADSLAWYREQGPKFPANHSPEKEIGP